MKKVILAGLVAMTASTAMAGRIDEDKADIDLTNFRDYRSVIDNPEQLDIDHFVAQYEGWGFNQAYEEAKRISWGDVCNHVAEDAKSCSDSLAYNWGMQHAAAYIVADLVQNRGIEMNKALEYVNVLTTPADPFYYTDGGYVWHPTGDVWDIGRPDDLITEYIHPTSHEFAIYAAFTHVNKQSYSSRDFIHKD